LGKGGWKFWFWRQIGSESVACVCELYHEAAERLEEGRERLGRGGLVRHEGERVDSPYDQEGAAAQLIEFSARFSEGIEPLL
jgi:hypothetical protein